MWQRTNDSYVLASTGASSVFPLMYAVLLACNLSVSYATFRARHGLIPSGMSKYCVSFVPFLDSEQYPAGASITHLVRTILPGNIIWKIMGP